jgi:hypothetical protein
MMNRETKLKLQAFVDHELSEGEAQECATWQARDPEASALCAELKAINELIEGNELEFKVPESREFYWSKIERAISAEKRLLTPLSFVDRYRRWIRFVAPATGLALVLVTILSISRFSGQPPTLSYLHEIEMPIEDTSAISFYSQSAGVTVVWIKTEIY